MENRDSMDLASSVFFFLLGAEKEGLIFNSIKASEAFDAFSNLVIPDADPNIIREKLSEDR